MANPSLTALIAAQTPGGIRQHAGALGRESMATVGNPGQQGQPMGLAPQAGGAPGVLAPMMMPQAPMVAQQMPGVPMGAAQGVAVPPQQPTAGDIGLQLILQLMNMPPQQIMSLIQQIPDPGTQQQLIQIVAMINPMFAQAIGMAGPAQPQIQQAGGNVLGSLSEEELLAAGGGANLLG